MIETNLRLNSRLGRWAWQLTKALIASFSVLALLLVAEYRT
jgi:hypothetical protein